MTLKLYTIFCECGWETEIGEDGQPLDDFIFHLRGASSQPCPNCNSKKLLIRNNNSVAP
jgi:hypothetical protein